MEQEVKFSGILKLMPSPETLATIDALLAESPLSKRYTKEMTTMNALIAIDKLVEL